MLVLMERQHLVDMCVLRKVEEHRTRGIMPPKIFELKQEHVASSDGSNIRPWGWKL